MPGLPSSQNTRKRRSLPKTRTGCLTCKKRRVKCGEEKPKCLRCIKLANWSGDCEYPQAKAQFSQRELLPRGSMNTKVPILPKTTPTSNIGKPPTQGTASNTVLSKHTRSSPKDKPQELIPFPFRSCFRNQEEYRFHKFFCNEVADELAAFSPSNLWQQSILQAAEAESFIRDAVIAIGALYEITHKAPYMRPCDAHQLFKDDHAFAVQEYQKSLTCMRDAISGGSMDIRTALIACLLTVCFETAYGRKDLALLNCQSGAKMRRKFSVPLLNNGSPHRDLSGSRSSTSPTVEDELVAVFSRLDISAMIYIDYHSADDHRIFKDELDDVIREMPFRFTTLEEAIAYGNVIMNRCWHFINIIQGLDRSLSWPPEEYTQDFHQKWASAEVRYGSNPWTGTDEAVPTRWLKDAADCSMELQKWFLAFDPLWRKFKHSPECLSKEVLQAILLRLQALSTHVSVRGSVYRRETDWDIHIPDFDEIVSLAEIYLSSKPKRFYFAFEAETIIYLYYVLWKCRDGGIRRRALKGLDERPRRESCWDAGHSGSVGRWVMLLEEGDRGEVECHEINEEDRVRLAAIGYDTANGQIRTWGYRLQNGERVYLSHQWPE